VCFTVTASSHCVLYQVYVVPALIVYSPGHDRSFTIIFRRVYNRHWSDLETESTDEVHIEAD
jgi:hypothetical protein